MPPVQPEEQPQVDDAETENKEPRHHSLERVTPVPLLEIFAGAGTLDATADERGGTGSKAYHFSFEREKMVGAVSFRFLKIFIFLSEAFPL